MAPAAAGFILGVSTPGAVYAAGAVCLVVAALLVVPLRDLVPPLAPDPESPREGAVRQLEEGARALAHSSASREVVIVLAATFLIIGAFDVLAVVLAVGSLDIGGSGAGYLTAAHGAGAVVGALIAIASVRGALFFTGAIVPVIVLLRFRPLRAVDAAVAVPVVTIALLCSLQVFRALPVPALEGIAHAADNLSVPAGTVIVRQGDPGDRYYAIADGTVEVLRGIRSLATLGRGKGFGEIALLHDVTRFAIVVAVTDTTLVAIERGPFLVAITGQGQTRERLEVLPSQRLVSDST